MWSVILKCDFRHKLHFAQPHGSCPSSHFNKLLVCDYWTSGGKPHTKLESCLYDLEEQAILKSNWSIYFTKFATLSDSFGNSSLARYGGKAL